MQGDEQRRPPPASTVQAAGQAASDVIGGLKQQPMLLALVTLNLLGIAAAVWFLNAILTTGHERYQELMKHCLQHVGR